MVFKSGKWAVWSGFPARLSTFLFPGGNYFNYDRNHRVSPQERARWEAAHRYGAHR